MHYRTLLVMKCLKAQLVIMVLNALSPIACAIVVPVIRSLVDQHDIEVRMSK